jgi:hypothetical protein
MGSTLPVTVLYQECVEANLLAIGQEVIADGVVSAIKHYHTLPMLNKHLLLSWWLQFKDEVRDCLFILQFWLGPVNMSLKYAESLDGLAVTITHGRLVSPLQQHSIITSKRVTSPVFESWQTQPLAATTSNLGQLHTTPFSLSNPL